MHGVFCGRQGGKKGDHPQTAPQAAVVVAESICCPGGRGDGRGWHLFRLPDDAHCVFFCCCMICGGWLAGVGVQQFANLIYDDDGGGDGDELILSKITLARRSIPAVFLDHVGELYDVLALLVLLAGLEGVLIFPP